MPVEIETQTHASTHIVKAIDRYLHAQNTIGKPTFADFLFILRITAALLVEVDAVSEEQGARHAGGNAERRTAHVHPERLLVPGCFS